MKPRHLLAAVATSALVASGVAAVAAPASPERRGDGDRRGHHHHHGHQRMLERIDLPAGFRPEGIAAGEDRDELYVGSIPTGRVLRADTTDGELETVVEGGAGRAAIGLDYDERANRLFVSGGPTGKAFVYDARDGAEDAQFQLAPPGEPTFVNDVALTRDTAYFTDSRRPYIYAVARDLSGSRAIATPSIPQLEGNNLNGIVATPRGEALLAVQTNAGLLWRIDPATGDAAQVDLGGYSVANGDGLLRKRDKLFVVQNQRNTIAVFDMADDFASGSLIGTITSKDFAVPTTLARQGRDLWTVNARFGVESPETAAYWISRVPRW